MSILSEFGVDLLEMKNSIKKMWDALPLKKRRQIESYIVKLIKLIIKGQYYEWKERQRKKK